nr:hypothetical protein [Acinetobacter sp. Marseille-Q1620]
MSMEHIIFSKDELKSNDDQWNIEYIKNAYWQAFGDLLDEVFLPNYPQLHESIKSEEGKYFKYYSFAELDKLDFNLSIKLIRQYLKVMKPSDWSDRTYVTNMSKWQDMAKNVWLEIVEPKLLLDSRYDCKLLED